MDVINPTTGQRVKSYPEHSPEEVQSILEQVHATYLDWKRTSFSHRTGLMKRAAEVLRTQAQEYAELMAVEMGKPVRDGRAEVEKCAWVCDYYAEKAESFLASEIVLTEARKSFIAYRPIGIVLAVMPWNFPFWQVFRFAAPALMAGNVGVLKHASNVPGSALAIEDVFRRAGFPDHAFRTLLIGSRQVAQVIEHPLVRAVTLTGSTPAGKAVASKAGEMLKKTVLELGGSDPYVILEDADLEAAAATCATSRLINAGQSCIAAKRFVVVETVRREFERLLVDNMKKAVMGDPLQEETTVGPQARHDLRDELHAQVEKSIARGATLLLGGEIPDDPGAFYPPTVLTDVQKGQPAYEEELFGPVAAIIPVKDEAEALRVANDTIFGLGSAVFTRDLQKGERIATEELEAGAAFVNSFVKSDPRLPFGGIKESGYGRELAANGIREFVNIKTVYIQ
ncbi:MAG: NAD-dependent succinate-semialdehyde dehydrogenase [Candidatus Neomarinimicrobiota bacterium]|nr:MAG: NAD-dependent succinate-semialdehyde dehydrogenase [Candidatus Neomarinimicrobiota bacterium]